jgi:protein-tyrosine phosphatase
MDETLRHLRRFRAQGVTRLVFTPHLYVPDLDAHGIEAELARHRRRFRQVRMVTRSLTDVPRLHLGQEILAPTPHDLERVVDRDDVGLDGGALLVELGFRPGFDGDGVVRRARAQGRSVVLAHVERYRFGDEDGVVVAARWKALGARLQVNGGSVGGEYTEGARELARRLLEEGLVDVVATDHHGDDRPHEPRRVARWLEDWGRASEVDELMGAGPRGVLEEAATPAPAASTSPAAV